MFNFLSTLNLAMLFSLICGLVDSSFRFLLIMRELGVPSGSVVKERMLMASLLVCLQTSRYRLEKSLRSLDSRFAC